MANISEESSGNRHRDVRPSQIKKTENDTDKVLQAFETFMNPFTLEADDKLSRISSGAAAPPEIEVDITRAESVGRSAKESFIEERLKKNKRFFDPIPKQRLKHLQIWQSLQLCERRQPERCSTSSRLMWHFKCWLSLSNNHIKLKCRNL